jgi:CDP-diglyceride synthetase
MSKPHVDPLCRQNQANYGNRPPQPNADSPPSGVKSNAGRLAPAGGRPREGEPYDYLAKLNRIYSDLKNICVWNKTNAGMGSLYRSKHELVFVFKAVAGAMPSAASMGVTVLGAAWIGLGLAHLVLVRELPEHGALALFTVVLAVFASDTAAYVAGRVIGRHKMAPQTSPGKTWEGFVAGTIAALLVPFFALYEEGFLTVPESLVLGAVIAVAGPVGDLFESAVKRDAGVKDSGRVLLGHGGMLDRLDAFLFTGVAAYYLLLAFGAA